MTLQVNIANGRMDGMIPLMNVKQIILYQPITFSTSRTPFNLLDNWEWLDHEKHLPNLGLLFIQRFGKNYNFITLYSQTVMCFNQILCNKTINVA